MNNQALIKSGDQFPDVQDEDALEAPWSRWEGETEKAYAGFLRYLHMGPERTLVKAYYLHSGKEVPLVGARHAPGHWCKWASENQWVRRANEYDRFQERRRDAIIQGHIDETYLELAQELRKTTQTIIKVLRGEEELSSGRYGMICKTMEWLGVSAPRDRLDTKTGAPQQHNVVVYIPDNGRTTDKSGV